MPRNPIPQSISEREHDCFGKLQHHFAAAHDACLQMSKLRSDQRDNWEKVAVLMKAVEGQIMDLATQGMFSTEDGKYGGDPRKIM